MEGDGSYSGISTYIILKEVSLRKNWCGILTDFIITTTAVELL